MNRSRVGLAVTLAFLVACAGRGSGPVNSLPQAAAPGALLPATGGTELPEPPVVQAVDGVAKFSLIAENDQATGEPTFEYKGALGVIPTIVVDPGDTIELRLKDKLPNEPPPEVMPDTPMPDEINLHFHGLGSSPEKPGDDVLTTLAKPGETLHYVVHVPVTQEPGLYWYHPHVHGQTSYQVGESGISGAIVVRGIEKHLPELGRMKHRLIIVRATGIGANAEPEGGMPPATAKPQNSNKEPCLFHDGLTVTLNGVAQPDISIAPGERQFFRVVNATGHKTLKLAVEGENVQLVAVDGFALDTYPGTPPTESMPYLIVPPASRAEFIVTGPAGGHGKFRTLCYNSGPNGDGDPPWLLAHLVAPKKPDGGDFSRRPITVGAPLPQDGYSTKLPPPAAKRVVVFSENNKPQFFINGKRFSMKSKPMYVVRVGTVEEWHVVNVTQEIHDFHIHQLHFLVQRINGVPVKHPFWADSFVLPHRYPVGTKSIPGTLDLLMDFRSPLIRGEFLFHCHILDHEDEGMMAKIEAI
ncbi:MAG TPA: multicopper oxidase family protein [Candidatus Cybelea sp.]|nr:multicopper oxidase family protein [Candidatus Cybelea sp.]